MADEKRKSNDSEQPPKIRVTGDKKSDTARIDISKAIPPPSVADGDLKEVGKDALSEFYKKSTIRIDQPKKSDTQRIKEETQRIKDDTQKIMSETKRIDDVKQLTMRVEVSNEKKDTSRLPPVSDLSKQSTAKIDVDEGMQGEIHDVFKRKTIPVGVPTPPPQDARPKTGMHIRPKTAQFKPPPNLSETVSVSPPPTGTTAGAKKSETARIDLPHSTAGHPTTRPKTIRIKRPDGTSARKQLTIARHGEGGDAVPVVSAAAGAEADVGTTFLACALAAVVVTCLLIYVLMAQTIATSLSFPGRI
ncbi:MAG: hypothetical protein V1929_02595 [bacterium]